MRQTVNVNFNIFDRHRGWMDLYHISDINKHAWFLLSYITSDSQFWWTFQTFSTSSGLEKVLVNVTAERFWELLYEAEGLLSVVEGTSYFELKAQTEGSAQHRAPIDCRFQLLWHFKDQVLLHTIISEHQYHDSHHKHYCSCSLGLSDLITQQTKMKSEESGPVSKEPKARMMEEAQQILQDIRNRGCAAQRDHVDREQEGARKCEKCSFIYCLLFGIKFTMFCDI